MARQPKADKPAAAAQPENDAEGLPSKEEFVAYLGGYISDVAGKLGLAVFVRDLDDEKKEIDSKKWPSWRFPPGDADGSRGRVFQSPADVPAGWTDAIGG